MTKVKYIALLSLVALIISACTSDVPVSVNEQAAASEFLVESTEIALGAKAVTKPFMGAVHVETIVGEGPFLCMFMPEEFCAQRCPSAARTPTWVIAFSGQGHATHLGHFEASAAHCSDVEFDMTTMLPVSAVYGDGEFEIVAANGDQIFGTYGMYGEGGDGTAETIGPGVADFHDRVVMTGGTGRFANVAGTIQEDGLFDVMTGAITQWKMHGEIVYSASDRSSR